MKYASFLLAVIVIGCSNNHDYSQLNFDNKMKQISSERFVAGQLVMTDSLNLEERFGIMNGSSMRADSDYIYINDPFELKIYAIDKKSYASRELFSPSRGQGPREVRGIGNFTVSNRYILIADERQMKVQVWSKSGEFINEFITDGVRPHRIVESGESKITLLSPIPGQSFSLFHTFDMNGNHIQSFGEPEEALRNPLKYSGGFWSDGQFLYFAGLSEHILVKFDMDGNHIYSRATIDDYPGEQNYSIQGSEDNRRFGYVEGGYFSAAGGVIYNNILLIMHVGESPSTSKTQFIDLYKLSDGSYIGTLEIPRRSGLHNIAVDDNNIYVLTDEDDITYLAVYENNINELLGGRIN